MIYLVSACLLGEDCKYSGGNNRNEKVIDFCCCAEDGSGCVIPICPELMGGLSAPRPPCEIIDGDGAEVLAKNASVLNSEGSNLTKEFIRGAHKVLELALAEKHRLAESATEEPGVVAILKAKSPSCGVGRIYDGTFSHAVRDGDGVTAALLRTHGIQVCTEADFAK